MPISVVVGGQFGSEGKGKVALHVARERNAAAVVRVGGTNSGHTGVRSDGAVFQLRQLPAASLADDALVILPPGSLIDPEIFRREVKLLELTPKRVIVDPAATVIQDTDIQAELESGLRSSIGSTGSGTGAALQRRIGRKDGGVGVQAMDHPELQPFLGPTARLLRGLLDQDKRIVIEGTQGFGLSLLHGGYYPKCTSRDTTAGAFISEAGVSPMDVDQVVLVIRTFPIRVAGDSGDLPNEISWAEVAQEAGLPSDYCELTTATKKVRRVARFDGDVVRRAIAVNNPTDIALNHLDYVDAASAPNGKLSEASIAYVRSVEEQIGRSITWIGNGPASLLRMSVLENEIAA